MKKFFKLAFLAIVTSSLVAFAFKPQEKYPTLTIGTDAPMTSVKMKATKGSDQSLSDLKKENGLLVIFTSNSCPFVVGSKDWDGWEGRYNAAFDAAKSNKVGMVLINSNEAKRDDSESLDNMKTRATSKSYKASYLLDKDSKLANAFGAKTTPHVFLFDKNMKLVYVGAMDDNCNKAGEVKQTWLKNALTNLASNKKIDPNSTRNKGCSIKRKI